MELNGKCKEEFSKYYKKNSLSNYVNYGMFLNNLPNAMKFGVYQEFFDEQGMCIEISKIVRGWCFLIEGETDFEDFKTRQEARIEAIKTANNLFNEQWKK